MTVELFDMGVRLRAAHTRRVQCRLVESLVERWDHPVAVTITGSGEKAIVSVQRPGLPARVGVGVVGLCGLERPDSLDPNIFEQLVVEDRGALRRLVALAATVEHADGGVASTVGWWAQRAEHPGTAAVIVATDACRQRWMTGEDLVAERDVATWQRWLGLPERVERVGTLLDIAEVVSSDSMPTSFRSLNPSTDDSRSWENWLRRVAKGWDWRRPDGLRSASIGLAHRENATEFHERVLLADSAWAQRSRFTGRIVDAVVVNNDRWHKVQVRAVIPVSRWRDGTTARCVTPRGECFVTVTDTTVDDDGGLVLSLSIPRGNAQKMMGHNDPGTPVRIEPQMVSRHQQTNRVKNLSHRLAGNTWLTDKKIDPDRTRREVPLDVIVAGTDFSGVSD